MKQKRAWTLMVAALAGLSIGAGPALAESWPQKPIMLIVPFAASGGTDAFARPLAVQLDQQLSTRVLIENRAGGGGTIGAAAAAESAPDGYTFFVGAAHHAIAPAVYPKLSYSIETDFIPIALIARPPHVVVVHPGKVAATTLAELIAYARANPDKINYGSAGGGTTHHLAGGLFKLLTNTRINHIPYRGAGPLMQDLLAGYVDMAFDGLGTSAAQISEGRGARPRRCRVKPGARFPQSSDGRGSRRTRVRGGDLVCALGAKEHAGGDRHPHDEGTADGSAGVVHQGGVGAQRLRRA